ncbi:MAG: glycoside hydrolase family 32 protein [Acidobacteriaceae bacterium]
MGDETGVGTLATRRTFCWSAAAVAAIGILPAGFVGEEQAKSEGGLARDPMRPQFHLLPARNWMNDPNGPIYFKGRYHMFFQYDPLAAVWGDMSWNHAVSTDMIHWRHLPLALTPTPGGPDAYGCFSGSAIAVGERVYVVYTGVQKSSDALATIRDGQNNIAESQCLAWSDDPMLVKWEKDPVPVVGRPPVGMKFTGFRDPSAWKSGDGYYMTVGSGVEGVGGCVLLYRSRDLKSWEYLHELTSGEWDGKKTANPCDDGEMWECPEFFALGDPSNGGGHVLIYSTLGKVFWESGVLDAASMRFTAKKKGELDWGAFYAPKTQLDARGRRILWGWIQERRDDAAMKAAGWSGMMSLPRVLTLDADGSLRMEVLPELATLRAGAIAAEKGEAGARRAVLPRATGEALCVGARAKDFLLMMGYGTSELWNVLMKIAYEAETHAFKVDGRTIALEAGDTPNVHAFVDGSVVEVILGERVGFTKRFYYTEGVAPDIVVVADGAETLEGWRVEAISEDRLTG